MSSKNNATTPITEEAAAEQKTAPAVTAEAPAAIEKWKNETAGKIEILVDGSAVSFLPGETKELPAGFSLQKYRLTKA